MTLVTGKKTSELEEIFNAQSKAVHAEGASFQRDAVYADVVCDVTLTRIPLDAAEIFFRVIPSEHDSAQLSDDVMFSLILAQGTLNSVFLDVPFDSTVDVAEIMNTAESSGFGVNLKPPVRPAIGSAELDRYFATLREYGRAWLGTPQSNIRVSPIDGYIEYKLGVATGHTPSTISTDQMMTEFYTDALGAEAMDAVKVVLDDLILEMIGSEDAFNELVENTAKAIILKDRQFMGSRAKIIEAELDLRTPVPNLIRLTAAQTGLSIVNAAGLLYEMKLGIHAVLDKYMPGDKDKEGLTSSEAQTKFAQLISTLFVGSVGGQESFDALWNKITEATQAGQRSAIDRGQVEPGSAAVTAADMLGAEPKTAALAIIEGIALASAVFQAGGAVPPPPDAPDSKPSTGTLGLIAVGFFASGQSPRLAAPFWNASTWVSTYHSWQFHSREGRSVPNTVAFINVTRQCNVDCKRCYLTPEHRAGKERLAVETLSAFLNHDVWRSGALLIWEGGEPVAVGYVTMDRLVRAAREALPDARQTMVTNCFSVPNWLIDMAFREFGGELETTFALGQKANLAGSESSYLQAFTNGLNRFWEAGISCPVNVELNRETVGQGVDALAGYILSTKCKVWEFDISVDFAAFLANPSYTNATTPILPLTCSHKKGWEYMVKLRERWGAAFRDAGISIGVFEQKVGERNNQFNVLSEHRFFTLNPDGTVTTNPLYSDLTGTFLGNLCSGDSMEAIVNSRSRMSRILEERRRIHACTGCHHLPYCAGGPSHVVVHDGSGECAGGKAMWNALVDEAAYA
jgi:radical SAM protein with 4Fe4S-binding SPASM domain